MGDCCTQRKLCCFVLLCLLVAGITGGAIGIYKWHYSGLNRWHGRGSTADFQKIIQERCDYYTQQMRPGARVRKDGKHTVLYGNWERFKTAEECVKLRTKKRNCQGIRQAFTSAFISKDPCKAAKDDYKPLLDLAHPTVPCDKAVFWSKTRELAHEYAKQRGLLTLEDTLLGSLADGLRWCGSQALLFAENVCGTVQVVLNGSIENAFDKMSIFGRVEAPNLRPAVTLKAWLVHDPGNPPSDSCSGPSIKELESILNQRSVRFICRDNLSRDQFLGSF